MDAYSLLLVIAPSLKLLRYTSIGKWINELLFICTMEYLPFIKQRNQLLIHATTCMRLIIIMLSGRSHTQDDYVPYGSFIRGSGRGNAMGTLNTSGVGM